MSPVLSSIAVDAWSKHMPSVGALKVLFVWLYDSLHWNLARPLTLRRTFALAATLGLSLFHESAAGAIAIGSGFSAMWFDPARNGEGLQLEILDADRALVEWYTFNEQGGQRWFQGVGQIIHSPSGDSIEFPQLYVTSGGHFGPGFDPSKIQPQLAGSATLSFTDCNTGTFYYDAFGQSQTLPVQRLTLTMGAGCTPLNGIPGQPVMPHAGQSGSWYDVSHAGEGFALQWMSRDEAIVTWYTYDTQGNQVWLLGIGTEQQGVIVFDHMLRARGPHFGSAFDPAAFQAEDWGALTLQLSCNDGAAHYESSQPEFGSGDLVLTRLTKLQQPDCPTVVPKLSDLYDITWDELPIQAGTVQDPNYYSADSISDDGTVAGRHDEHLVLWHPDTRSWENVPRQIGAIPVLISPDSSTVIATDEITTDPTLPVPTLRWQRSTGWTELPGVKISVHSAASHNFLYVVGYGRDDYDGGDSTWVQEIGGSQQLLPNGDVVPIGLPYAVSNDGRTIVGIGLRFPTPSNPQTVAVRRNNDGEPTILHDPSGEELSVAAACDANCSIVFGEGLYNFNPNHAHPGEAWLLKDDGTFEYLGALPDAPITPTSYALTDVTPDGSLVVGAYEAYQYVDNPAAGTGTRAFIWTQATGILSVRSLFDDLGIGDDDWNAVYGVRVSADGHSILLSGIHALDPSGSQVEHSRAVVLHLTSKSSD